MWSVAAIGLLGTAPVSGCAQCSPGDEGSGTAGSSGGAAGSAAVLLPPRVPGPSPWTFSGVRGPQGVAAPAGCRQRAPLLRAKVPRGTHFVADGGATGVLVVADTEGDPPAVVRSGTLALSADATSPVPSGTGAPGDWVPWPDAGSAPRLARAGQGWIAAWESGEGSRSAVTLFRGGEGKALGAGDAFVAADLQCGASRCALLTSRKGRVAPAGADVLLFDPKPGAAITTAEIEPGGGSQARPFGLASVDGARGPVAVLADGGEAVFWRVEGEGGPSVTARLPADNGILDAVILGDRPLVLAHGNVVDEEGCAREGADAGGAKVRLVRANEPAVDLRTPGAPSLAALRPLGAGATATGALAVWVSPLGCGAPRRVVFGVALDAAGAPVGSPIPIADGETFALAVSGQDADLWIRRGEEVSWLRLACEAR